MSSKKGKGKGKKKGKQKKTEECSFSVGDRVQVKTGDLANELGYVRFVGNVKGKDGIFIGVELDEARGKHDGEVKSVRYFKTAEKHGYMAPSAKFQHFEANEIAMGWDNKVELITLYWFRNEVQSQLNDEEKNNENNELNKPFIKDGLEWIIKYGQLLRFQNVYGVGNNEYGELGLSEIKEKLKFTKMKIKDIERGYASDGNFFLIRGDEQNNHILSAGNNNWCQLGLGRGNHRTIMKLSKIKKFSNILFVSRGMNSTHTFFVMKNNEIFCCGNNTMNQLPIPNNGNVVQEKPLKMPLKKTPFIKDRIMDIKCGLMHTLFLTQSGKLYGIGGNEDAQIGLGKNNVEQEIDKITAIKGIKGKIKAIECSMNASFAVTVDGVVYSWGKNNDAVLGQKKKMDRRKVIYQPTKINLMAKILDISCSAKHVIVMDENQNCHCWGANKLGQCGIGKPTEFVDTAKPLKLSQDIKISEWRVGSYHTFLRTSKGEWYSFGSNAFRQCMLSGGDFDETVPGPTLIDTKCLPKGCDPNKMEIVCGRETTLVLF